MLILTRRVGESLLIGDAITVTVLDVQGQAVKVGIEAPRDVLVLREEGAQRDGVPPSIIPGRNRAAAVRSHSRLVQAICSEGIQPTTTN